MHVDYNMKMIFSCDQGAFREIIRDRKIGYISGPDYRKFEHELPHFFGYSFFWGIEGKTTTDVGDNDLYLLLSEDRENTNEKKDDQREEKLPVEECKLIEWINEEKAIHILRGKSLVFQVSYIEEHGNTEEVIRKKFFEQFCLLKEKNKECFYLYDDFYDVRIFLQKVDEQTVQHMEYSDVRDFDINTKILQFLREESVPFLEDGWHDFTAEFAAVSDTINAQYFLTRYHSNTLWNLNPVCIFCFRISVFILPGNVTLQDAVGLSEDKLTINYKNGDKYVIDSIHFNSDICADLTGFKELIGLHYYDVTLA